MGWHNYIKSKGLVFSNKSSLAIGVDIGSSSVKVMEMSESRGRYRIERFAVEQLPRNVVVENTIADIERVGKAIRTAVSKSGTRRNYAVAAVAAAQAINKVINVAGGMSGSELEQQIEVEAEHYIPYSIAEVNLDFEVLTPSIENPSNDEVMLAACRKEIVDERIAALQAAGLKPRVMEITSLSNQRAFDLVAPSLPDGGVEKVVAIVDYGNTSSHLYVLHRRRLVYHRDYPFGGKSLTESIQQRFGISYSEAENKKRSGDLPENYRTDILEPFVESMALEANRAIQLFISSTQHTRVDYVFVTGGSAGLPGAVERIGTKTGINTRMAYPFSTTKIGSAVSKDRLKRYAPVLFTACGLAMRGATK
ncbi:MAG: pilus assembly protein PilM [Proteobacteria bacterium]|nr:MAG: pilus assembly protein PilM [Pseudomonadota bacterium]